MGHLTACPGAGLETISDRSRRPDNRDVGSRVQETGHRYDTLVIEFIFKNVQKNFI